MRHDYSLFYMLLLYLNITYYFYYLSDFKKREYKRTQFVCIYMYFSFISFFDVIVFLYKNHNVVYTSTYQVSTPYLLYVVSKKVCMTVTYGWSDSC